MNIFNFISQFGFLMFYCYIYLLIYMVSWSSGILKPALLTGHPNSPGFTGEFSSTSRHLSAIAKLQVYSHSLFICHNLLTLYMFQFSHQFMDIQLTFCTCWRNVDINLWILNDIDGWQSKLNALGQRNKKTGSRCPRLLSGHAPLSTRSWISTWNPPNWTGTQGAKWNGPTWNGCEMKTWGLLRYFKIYYDLLWS